MALLSFLNIMNSGPSLHGAGPSKPEPRIEIAEAAAPVIPTGMPVIRWVAKDDVSWKQGEPSFTIPDGKKVKARGWLAVTDDSILMKVIVADENHINNRETSEIWDGDCLQIGIDSEGNGAGNQAPGTRAATLHVGAFAVALTKRGPEIWAYYLGKHGPNNLSDGARHYPCTIVRDEAAKMTTYEVAFPWEEFATEAGIPSIVGLCVQVNDAEKSGQQRYYWGRGADGQPRPGLFEHMAVGAPALTEAGLVATEAMKTRLFTSNSSGEIEVAIAKDANLEISASMSGIEKKFKIGKTSRKDGIRRFIVRGTPGALPSAPVTLSARLTDASGKVLAERKAELTAPGGVVEKFHDKIESLTATSPDPLFTDHLRSLDALVHSEWNRGLFLEDASPSVAEFLVDDCQTLLESLAGDAGDWKTYQRGERALILARSANPDSTLQFFLLKLPRNWDPAKTYPLIVDLHGAGPRDPLAYPMMNMEPRKDPPAPVADGDQQYFRLSPWGRGNSGYYEWGENDVFEAMDAVTKEFKTDKDRTYLTGHSMGGGGTWGIGLRVPDRWAAVCPVAGGTWLTPMGAGLGANASYVPFRIRHGDADTAVDIKNAYAMQAELRTGGNEPDMVIEPGHGHGYDEPDRQADTQWLLQHTRKRPDHFSYTADTQRWLGAWGILMDRPVAGQPLPHFDCTIKGQEVRITSSGTKKLTVQPGQGGLGLTGQVAVWWNDKKVYEGPAKELKLGGDEE